MWRAIKKYYKTNKKLIDRTLFTLLVLFLFRIGALITIPGVTLNNNGASTDGRQSQEFFNLISMLGGGSLNRFSILALGVSPYITASIIVQLLSTDVIPSLTRWAKSGRRGRDKLNRLTKFVSVPFAALQGFATIETMSRQRLITVQWDVNALGMPSPIFYYFLIPIILIAGTLLALWMADQISVRGLGNGLSMIIFGGIAARLPQQISSTFNFWVGDQAGNTGILFQGLVRTILYFIGFLLVILFVVWFSESERRIPIKQTGSGLALKEEKTSYLPLKVNSAGVIPVIFSSAIITALITIAQLIPNGNNGFVWFSRNIISFQTWPGIVIFAVLTILFTYLYAQVQINPERLAKNLQKSGTYVAGIHPGKATEIYIRKTVTRLCVVGSLFLAIVAVLPYLIAKITNLPSSLAIGGTGLIILVSVALQTVKQIRGQLTQHRYISMKKEALTAAPQLW